MSQDDFENSEPPINPQDKQVSTKLLGDYSIVEKAESSTPRFDANIPPARIVVDILHNAVQIVFDLSESTIFGRSYPKSLTFDGIDLAPFDAYEKGVSHHHATFIRDRGYIIIRDLDSRNGTLVNGKRLQAKRNYVLQNGDLIHLGNLALRIRFLYSPLNPSSGSLS